MPKPTTTPKHTPQPVEEPAQAPDQAAPVEVPAAAPEVPSAALSPLEAYLEEVQARREAVDAFEATVTQREWLIVCRKLEADRAQINREGSLRLLALGWIKEKRDHGGASWDALLEMTDRQILALHGFPEPPADLDTDDDDED